jgi:hypothetical protein
MGHPVLLIAPYDNTPNCPQTPYQRQIKTRLKSAGITIKILI